ncbi:MAG: VWA domain-containing protein [Acidimicrobiales bacterium]|nr:VWA domain-containing protein [Acidimicrobiales bacterium]MCB9394070.1 VWA domain-containing protein [Acidimicrobiaceae bacterium]
MSFAHPWGLALLGFVVPVVLLHVLRPRRAVATVSSTMLWRDLQQPVSAAAPWQRFRWSLLLLLQLLAVVLAAVAVADPVRLTPATLAEHTVFVVDASGSMAATDGVPDRLASAVAEAERLRDELPDGGVASIVVATDRPRVALTASDDRTAFSDALGTIETTTGSADFADAFALAQSLETSDAEIGFVLLSDGGLTRDEQRLQPPGTTYRRIGSGDTNRAVTSFDVEPRGSSLHARATVKNTGGPTAEVDVRFDVDGVTAAVRRVELKPGLAVDVAADVPNGDRVEVFVSGTDLLAADDHAVAVGATRPDLRVLLVGETLFAGDLLAAIPGVELTVVPGGDAAENGDGYDVVVYHGVDVPADVAAPFFAIAPPSGAPGVRVEGTVDTPAVTLLRSDDPLLDDLDLTGVAIAAAQRVEAPLADELVGAEGAPLLLRGAVSTDAGRSVPYVYLSFALADSNLPVQVEFPLLGDRIVTELAGASVAPTSIEVGSPLPVPDGTALTVTAPDGITREVALGDASPRATRPGFWAVRAGEGPVQLIAVNPPTSESALATADELTKPFVDPTVARASAARGERSVVAWVIAALLVVVLLEWVIARRRVGVGRRQWRIAAGLRLVVAAVLLIALVAPVVRRPADRTATVFVVDLSASMGSTGRRAAEAWVRDAMAARDGDDLAAVVGFGAEARLDRVLEASSAFDGAQVLVDADATDLEAALRLADAVLVEDARRRIVVVSDGLATAGDAADEVERLRANGTQVDVHTVERTSGTDAAVDVLDAPSVARVGDAVEVSATVEATVDGPAEVVLRRDGDDIAAQVVDLVVGANQVAFTDVPEVEPGDVLRYQVVVTTPGDARPENDVGVVSVPVEGPARVLVVEGTAGEADVLAAALEAGNVGTEVVGVGDLPNVAELVTYSGIVLVDVDARALSGEQFETLATVVRDLGKGLVTVGGERSYGVGGYRGSPLEELLPVISEILDPKRRMTVAEVLSIDTSGSMANCHCDDGENPSGRIDGGVNKTDISRAAAARTIEALSASDEIGILAWNQGSKWVVDLQQLPADEVVEDGLRQLVPAGSTNLRASLDEAAAALRQSKAALKHIILFSDGFTDPSIIADVAEQAGELYEEEGITTSVIATGEGAAPSLEEIAIAGHGRFYPGENLEQVPQVIAEEAVIASRDFITEGEFLPEITAATDVTEPLTAAPALLGYVATTAKGTAVTSLRIGPDRDPLLATWQAGLGTVSSWTSDASAAWSRQWASWDGYVAFWSSVVKDTFAAGDQTGAVDARLGDGVLQIEVADDAPFPDGSSATAVVSGPDGQRVEVVLERAPGDRFVGEVPATRSGSYAVGVTVTSGGRTVLSSSTLADESYPAEFRPATADAAALARLSAQTGGRGEIEPLAAFDSGTLRSGTRSWRLRGALLLLAALVWPIAVVVSRLSLRGVQLADATGGARRLGRRVREAVPKLLPTDPGERPSPSPPIASPPADPTPTTPQPATPRAAPPAGSVNELLARKRARQSGEANDAPGDADTDP